MSDKAPRKDKNAIINCIVKHAADIMEARADELELIADKYDSKGEYGRAEVIRTDRNAIVDAVVFMRQRSWC